MLYRLAVFRAARDAAALALPRTPQAQPPLLRACTCHPRLEPTPRSSPSSTGTMHRNNSADHSPAARGSQPRISAHDNTMTTKFLWSANNAKTAAPCFAENITHTAHRPIFKQSPQLQASRSSSYSLQAASPAYLSDAIEEANRKADEGAGQDADMQDHIPSTQDYPLQSTSESNANPDPDCHSGSEHESKSEGKSQPESSMKDDEKKDNEKKDNEKKDNEKKDEKEDDEKEDAHVPLTYQIPPDDLAAAVKALPNTRGSFWTHRLYRGPNEKEISVHYCQKLDVAERVAKRFLGEKVLGFDMEWKPYGWPSSIKQNVSLIQIACEDRIALFHVALFAGRTAAQLVPPSLKIILESADIYKVGVNIKGDFTRLEKHLKVRARGVLELSRIHNLVERPEAGYRLYRLAMQVQQHLLLPLYKGEALVDDVVDEAGEQTSENTDSATKEQISENTDSGAQEPTLENTESGNNEQTSEDTGNATEGQISESAGNEVKNNTRPAERIENVRESDWSRALDNDQIHYAASDAYAGFRIYHVLESKRKQMKPVPPLPRLCDDDPVGRPSAPRRPRTTKSKPKVAEVVSVAEDSTDSQEYETAQEEMDVDNDGETADPDALSKDLSSSDDPPDADYIPERFAQLSLNEAEQDLDSAALQPSRRIGRVRMSKLTEAASGNLAFPSSILPESSDSDESDAFDAAPVSRLHRAIGPSSNKQTSAAQVMNEFVDFDLEDALMNTDIDSLREVGVANRATKLAVQEGISEGKHEGFLPPELPADKVTAHGAIQPDDTDPNDLDTSKPTDAVPAMTSDSQLPGLDVASSSPEYTAATSWAQSYIRDTIPSPQLPSSRPAGVRATTPHLRAFYLWHHLHIPVEEVGKYLRDPPLAQSTVSSYVLQAITLEKLDCDDNKLRALLETLPEATRMARWGRLYKKLTSVP